MGLQNTIPFKVFQRLCQKAEQVYDHIDSNETISLCDNYSERLEPVLSDEMPDWRLENFPEEMSLTG